MKYSTHYSTRTTPQSQPIPGEAMIKNSAGGYAYGIDKWERLNRFLILGSEGNTYYATEQKLTVENAENVKACIAEDGIKAVDIIVAVSDAGRAPKNDPAIFALAMASVFGSAETRKYALAVLPKVCRIPTHLFAFAEARQAFGGWGRGMREAVARWYDSQTVERLAFQTMKYRQRNGWTHRDLLRLSHPKTEDASRNALYAHLVGKEPKTELPRIVKAVQEALALDIKALPAFICEHGLTREMVPTEALNSPAVWEALLEKMPPTALLRSLGKLSAVGLLKPLSNAESVVLGHIGNIDSLVKARVHPIAVLSALKVYQQGHGERGSLTWTHVPSVVDALNEAFYGTFRSVTPTGKKLLVGVDVSGSMAGGTIAGVPGLTPAVCAAAFALVTAATEKQYYIMGFADTFRDLGITPKMRLDDVLRKTNRLNFEATDCSLPILYTLRNKLDVDAFITITDNETWFGKIHPKQALTEYRKTKVDARNVVVGMTATNVSIADPKDSLSLDVVGFDSAAPAVIADFIRG